MQMYEGRIFYFKQINILAFLANNEDIRVVLLYQNIFVRMSPYIRLHGVLY